jgi:hypothetical protein
VVENGLELERSRAFLPPVVRAVMTKVCGAAVSGASWKSQAFDEKLKTAGSRAGLASVFPD